MPTISKIRFANVVYENRQKRYNDETFVFDGHNSAILLENGGGKTVFVQTLLQAVIPHATLANRKAKDTFSLAQSAAHIAIEWILQDSPRVYALTAVTLFLRNDELRSYKYTYRYMGGDKEAITHLPFTETDVMGRKRPATAEEMHDYYLKMNQRSMHARIFEHISEYSRFLQTEFNIIEEEWRSLAVINAGEGDVAKFFEACKTTNDLVNKLLIPTVLMAIKSNEAVSFTDMFEQKRSYFKKYNQLKQQIAENQLIEAELAKVMKVYLRRHEAETNHHALRQKAKGYYQEVVKVTDAAAQTMTELKQKEESLHEEKQLVNEQTDSLGIAKELAIETTAKLDFDQHEAKYSDEDKKLAELLSDKTRLLYLRDRWKRDEKAAQIEQERRLLEQQAGQPDAADIEQELEFVCQQLRAILSRNEAEINSQIVKLDVQIVDTNKGLSEYKQAIQKQDANLRTLEKQEQRCKTTINFVSQEQEIIARRILANWQEQKVEQELEGWKQTAAHVQLSIAEQMRLSHAKDHEKLQKRTEADGLRTQLQNAKIEMEKLDGYFRTVDQAHGKLLEKLHFFSGLRAITSVYLEHGKIDAVLANHRLRCEKELEDARQRERRDFRLVDSYGDQSVFIFDPALASLLESCQLIVESGTAYLERLVRAGSTTIEEQMTQFPLWPLCLIVAESDRRELERKLLKMSDTLTSPVLILSEAEAKLTAEGKYSYQTLWPDFWPKVVDRHSFSEWKEIVNEVAAISRNRRIDKEQNVKQLEDVSRDLTEFNSNYPFAVYQESKDMQKKLQQDYGQSERSLSKAIQEEQSADMVWRTCQNTLRDLDGQTSDLDVRIKAALEWLEKDKERLRQEAELADCEILLDKAHQELAVLINKQQTFEDEKDVLDEKRQQWRTELSRLTGTELYSELQKYQPQAPVESELVLREKRQMLNLALGKINIERKAIEARIKQYQNEKADFDRRLKEYKLEMSDDGVFPIDGEVRILNLSEDINRVEAIVSILRDTCRAAENTWREARAKRETAEGFYREKFSNKQPHRFAEPLTLVEARLETQRNRILGELNLTGIQLLKAGHEQEKWQAVKLNLETQNGKLEFLDSSTAAAGLLSDEAQSFPYQGGQMAAELLRQLQESLRQLNELRQQSLEAKEAFESFCNSHTIHNEKMRQNALNGIRRKQAFAEMQEWVTIIKDTIAGVNAVAEQHLQEFNADIKFFVNQLHVHLVTIRDEIASVQKMTTVRVEDHYKTIYEIKTPSWDENEAKAQLMDHIEWMSDKLSSSQYRQEDGLEDSQKIRRDIEQWLSPSHLFRQISPGKGFSVGVRKVSNDNRISNYPVDWATSNSWSGGEKWSKNMALFLGIQSYLAEKLQPTKRRKGNTRTVVLDNPFGQASSDHVLEPVFFIAEKLGYQVIALTALAEGKFLRDYFPIIYSCRLRQAAVGDTEIIDKDLQINHAYFEDKDPQSLERLGQTKPVEQLALNW
ncbi:hypothetical protein [Sporomusa malonica]|uniref:Chromosome segregation ATPase n=2 Tax=Sporomusa malonica TaxID=112901 RepID=A0A1W1YCE3_9FIRM|nr:hypothetical protein SAMN04488500_101217 [Sporomusa malonica]